MNAIHPGITTHTNHVSRECHANENVKETSTSDRMVCKRTRGNSIAIRVHFQVEGSGSFRAGGFPANELSENAWVKPQSVLSLASSPGPGFQFSHWVVNNEYAGSSRSRRVVACQGMVIKAVFKPISSPDIRQ